MNPSRLAKIALLCFAFSFFWQCSQNTSSETTLVTAKEEASGVNNATSDNNWFKQFAGTINGTIAITMQLNRRESQLNGNYYYNRLSKPLRLSGYAQGDSLVVEEYLANGKSTGRFTGRLLADGHYTGVWSDGTGKRSYPFSLSESIDSSLQLSTITYYRSDCSYRDSVLKSGHLEDISTFDTVCSVFEAVQLVVGGLTPDVNKKINAKITAETLAMASSEEHSSFQSFVNGVVGSPYQELSIGAYVYFKNHKILSIGFTNDFYGGGAHPLHSSTVKNYDLRTGEEIALAEIFTSEFLEQINKIGEKEFVELNGAEGWDFKPGEFKVPTNFSISEEGVEFVFNQYEIGPYAAGMPSFFLSFSKYARGVQPQWLRRNI